MRKRKLGKSDLEVSALALGTNVFGWTVDEHTAFTILDVYVDAGGNLIDTADTYSRWVAGNRGGESEGIIGKWLRRSGKRSKVVIATKVGSEMGPDKKGLSRDYILREVEASLQRLQTDYIDLYQSHKDDPNTPIEDTLDAYAQLIAQGKVRSIGASNFSAERLARAVQIGEERGLPRYVSLQPRYNLYDRAEYEQSLEPVCREQGLGVITYYSLASGFLTGKYRSTEDLSKSIRGQGITIYLNRRGFRILDALSRVAEQYCSSPAAVALAWLMTRPGVTAPIASVTGIGQLRELIAGTLLDIDAASLDELTKASAE